MGTNHYECDGEREELPEGVEECRDCDGLRGDGVPSALACWCCPGPCGYPKEDCQCCGDCGLSKDAPVDSRVRCGCECDDCGRVRPCRCDLAEAL